MKCYFVYDDESGEDVLIPMCYNVVHSNNIEDCTCRPRYKSFEKEEYKKALKEMQDKIDFLQNENQRLNNLIKKYKK